MLIYVRATRAAREKSVCLLLLWFCRYIRGDCLGLVRGKRGVYEERLKRGVVMRENVRIFVEL